MKPPKDKKRKMWYIHCGGNKSKNVAKGDYFAYDVRGNPIFGLMKKPIYYKEEYDAWWFANEFKRRLKENGIRAKITVKSAMVLNDKSISLAEYDLLEAVKLLNKAGITPKLYTNVNEIAERIVAK